MSSGEYKIPASDMQGHSARHWFRTIPQMARVIALLVESRKFPYRTKGDLLRHALHRHVKWLESQDAVKSVSGQANAIIELMRDEEMNADFMLVFDKLAQRISAYISFGSSGEAARLLRVIQDHIKQMPDGYWRDRYNAQLADKFGHLIAGRRKAVLKSVEGDEDDG